MEPSQPPLGPSRSHPAPPGSRPPAARRWLRWLARAAEAAVLVTAVGALGLWCSVPDTAPLATHNPSSTAFIDLRRAEAAAAGKPFQLRWQWRPLGAISRYLRAAVIYAEDYNFYHHDGVDWEAVEHALSTDLRKRHLSVGGSTITQQLAKNLYLSPRRSLFRKAREALIAFALEDHLTKQRILELYLNVVEWGDGVFGAEAAARTWFHHGASALSPAEAVRLATALPNPITRAPDIRSRVLVGKHVRLIRLLRMQGLIDAAQERAALDEVGAPGERVLGDGAAEAAAVLDAAEPDDQPVTSPDDEPAPAQQPPAPAAPQPSQPGPSQPAPSQPAPPSEPPAPSDQPPSAPPAAAPSTAPPAGAGAPASRPDPSPQLPSPPEPPAPSGAPSPGGSGDHAPEAPAPPAER